MSFFNQLQNATTQQRATLLDVPLIQQAVQGELALEQYVAFLTQAYHHVKHTLPLLMAAGACFSDSQEWLREATAEYIEEELGHQNWILNDIAACGFCPQKARASTPNMATELMVSYAYDTIHRIDPIGFFGMVHVLEGTSIRVADQAAEMIQRSLDLPPTAFSYLRSHGALDQDHVKFFASLMNRIEDPLSQSRIIHCANVFYQLYADVLRSIDGRQASQIAA